LKKHILILLIIFFALGGCEKRMKVELQNESNMDSLINYISMSEDKKHDSKNRIFFAKEALKILDTERNDSITRKNLSRIANQLYVLKEEKILNKTLSIILQKSILKNDTANIAIVYYLKGNQYINNGKNDSAYFYLLKSEKLFKKINDSISLGKNYIDKAFVQLYENDYSGCELSAIQALGYLKSHKLIQSEYDAYNMIGISANELKNYENALIYHTKALNITKNNKLNSKFHYSASSRNNIGVVYQNLNRHYDAINSFNIALAEKDLLKDTPSMYAMIKDNLAYSKLKLKDFANLPELFFESLEIREKNEMSSGVIANKIHLSEFYSEIKDSINAQKYAFEALKLAKETKVSGDLLGSLKQLSIVEHKNAALYSKEYIKISDSLQQSERKAKDKFARIAFETDEIILQKDKLAEQNRSLLYFFVTTLLIGLLLFIIRIQRARNRELLLKEAQQKANEDIYSLMISQQANIEESRVNEKKRIAQELHDGVLGRLFGARLNLDTLNRFTDEESILSRFNYLAELKNIEQDIREISHDLNREKYVLINNFIAIVNNLLEQQQSSYNPNLTISIDESVKWDIVGNTVKINFYRILQESLQNINKYASANSINIEIKKVEESILLNISDDGIGFDVYGKRKGIGLQNMKSRVNECKGTFEVKSNKGKGTRIAIKIPIEKN